MDKRITNLTIFLIKDYISNFEDCLKKPRENITTKLKTEMHIDGIIHYCDSKSKQPKWKSFLDYYSKDPIDILDNTSNKAVLLIKVQDRIMAVVFGYGRSFLKEEVIERNFGFKVALNIINPEKMRSVNAATIEDMVVTTQRQSSYGASQDEFGLNVTNDIMKGITGEPNDEIYARHISGKDSLVVSVFMSQDELKDKLELYLSAYKMTRYKEVGFEWVDNISEVRDSILSENLDDLLVSAIENKETEHLHIAPPETTNWDSIIGFCYSGINKKIDDEDSYNLDLDIGEYLEKIKSGTNIYQKIKHDRLYAMNSDGTPFPICSIYSALTFQTEYENYNYILCASTWYKIDKSFFDRVNYFITQHIPLSSLDFPECPSGTKEGDYNKSVAESKDTYSLMDCAMVSVAGGPKKIEACDIFTANKQFIHVKNKGQSAQLSHLFAQGKVSAECFVSDEHFRKQIYDIVSKDLGSQIFNYQVKPSTNEYEIVFAIIDDKQSELVDKLPFFSKVNLMMTAQDLERMNYKYSVLLIKKQT